MSTLKLVDVEAIKGGPLQPEGHVEPDRTFIKLRFSTEDHRVDRYTAFVLHHGRTLQETLVALGNAIEALKPEQERADSVIEEMDKGEG